MYYIAWQGQGEQKEKRPAIPDAETFIWKLVKRDRDRRCAVLDTLTSSLLVFICGILPTRKLRFPQICFLCLGYARAYDNSSSAY